MESFPPELEKSVPLEMKSVLRYCDKLGPHYQAVGHLLGLTDTVRCLKSGHEELPSKVMQILDQWIENGKAKWSILVLGLERDIPRLRGLASEIRKDLREELEKCECMGLFTISYRMHNKHVCRNIQCKLIAL